MRYALTIFSVLLALTLPQTLIAQSYRNCTDPATIFIEPLIDTSRHNADGEIDFALQANTDQCKVVLPQASIEVFDAQNERVLLESFDEIFAPNRVNTSALPDGNYRAKFYFSFSVLNADVSPGAYSLQVTEERLFTLGQAEGVDPVPAIDTTRPRVGFSGLPTDESFKMNLKGTYNVNIIATDNRKLSAVYVFAFGAEWVNLTEANLPSDDYYSRTFILDTSKYSNGNYFIQITAIDAAGNTTRTQHYFAINNNFNAAPAIPEPIDAPREEPEAPGLNPIDIPIDIPEIPQLPELPDVIELPEDAELDEQTLQTLINLVTQIMQLLSQIDSLSEAESATRGINVTTMSKTLLTYTRHYRKDLRSEQKTKRVPRLTRKFSRTLKKAEKAKRLRKQQRMMKKSERLLKRILKRLV